MSKIRSSGRTSHAERASGGRVVTKEVLKTENYTMPKEMPQTSADALRARSAPSTNGSDMEYGNRPSRARGGRTK